MFVIMRKITTLLAFAFLLASCNDDKADQPGSILLPDGQATDLKMEYDGTPVEVRFTTDLYWIADTETEPTATWLRIEPTSGKGGG